MGSQDLSTQHPLHPLHPPHPLHPRHPFHPPHPLSRGEKITIRVGRAASRTQEARDSGFEGETAAPSQFPPAQWPFCGRLRETAGWTTATAQERVAHVRKSRCESPSMPAPRRSCPGVCGVNVCRAKNRRDMGKMPVDGQGRAKTTETLGAPSEGCCPGSRCPASGLRPVGSTCSQRRPSTRPGRVGQVPACP
jgi:hypothetical protein